MFWWHLVVKIKKKDINLGCDQRFLNGVKAPGTICNSHNRSYFVLYCHRRRTHSTLVFSQRNIKNETVYTDTVCNCHFFHTKIWWYSKADCEHLIWLHERQELHNLSTRKRECLREYISCQYNKPFHYLFLINMLTAYNSDIFFSGSLSVVWLA